MKPFPETSNYQILIGDVELGPRPELLDVAVPLFTLTRALVTDEQQTVILMNTSLIILDWSRWVTDTLGDSAGDASYTIRRIQLDVLGNPIRSPEEVQPTDLSSRIIVQLNPANNEYYVLISEAFVSAIGAEDPDRAIYELEGCVPESDGSEQCYKSNITVYALGPVFGPLGKTKCIISELDHGIPGAVLCAGSERTSIKKYLHARYTNLVRLDCFVCRVEPLYEDTPKMRTPNHIVKCTKLSLK